MFAFLTIVSLLIPGPLFEPAANPPHGVQPGGMPVPTLPTAMVTPTAVSRGVRPVSTQVVLATGVGRPPAHLRGVQARLMARRAAEVVAVRNLARKLGFSRHTRVRGFRYLPARFLRNGWVEVTVEYRLAPASFRRRVVPGR